jgi:hypothetical protein
VLVIPLVLPVKEARSRERHNLSRST